MLLISKEEAKAKNLRRFFTGVPCTRGHVSERFIQGWCVECSRQYQRDRYNPEAAKKRAAKFKLRNEELVRQRNYYAHIKRAYGLSAAEFEAMLGEQGKGCAICFSDKRTGKKFGPWSVDHCHQTGKIRGILCTDCNHMLGRAKDSPAVLENAKHYLAGRKADGMAICALMSAGA